MQAAVALELTGGDPAEATASYRVKLGRLSGCDETPGDHSDVDDDTFTPAARRSVVIEPAGAAPVALAEGAPGEYAASGAGYAASYLVRADGDDYPLPAPPWFTAEVSYTPGEGASATWSTDHTTFARVVPPGQGEVGGYQATAIDGQRATWEPAIFDRPGTWTAVFRREGSGATDPELARVSTRVEIERAVTFTVE